MKNIVELLRIIIRVNTLDLKIKTPYIQGLNKHDFIAVLSRIIYCATLYISQLA